MARTDRSDNTVSEGRQPAIAGAGAVPMMGKVPAAAATLWLSARIIAVCGAGYAVLAAASVLLGWLLEIRRLTDWAGNGLSTLPNTAVSGLCCGVSLLLVLGWRGRGAGAEETAEPSRPVRLAAAACALVTCILGGLTLVEHVFRVNLGIDTLILYRDWGQRGTVAPGRMGPPASFSFVLLGSAMMIRSLVPAGHRLRKVAAILGIIVVMLATLALVGVLFGAQALNTLPRLTAIAVPTATMLLALALSVISSVTDVQPMRLLTGASGASALLRRAMPVVILLPVLLGLLRIKGSDAGLFDANFGTALRTVVEIVLLGVTIWWAARVVEAHERALAQRNDEVLRQAALLEAIADSSDNVVVSKTLDGVVMSWNHGAEMVFGYTAAEAIGRHISFIIPQDRQHEEAALLERLRQGKRVEPFETVRTTKARKRIAVSVSISPIRDSTGRVVGAAKVAQDISKRKQVEEVLRRNEAMFAALVDQAPQGVYVVDEQFRIQQINSTAAPSFASVDGPIGRDLGEVLRIIWGPEVGDQCAAHFRRTLQTGEPYISRAFSGARQDLGEQRAYDWQIRRVTFPDGRHGLVCYFEDVTERHRAAIALRDSEERVRLANEASGVGIWEWNVRTGEVRWDAQMFRIYGLEPAPGGVVTYRTWADAVVPEDLSEQERILMDTVQRKGRSQRRFRIVRPGDPEPRHIFCVETVRTDVHGEVEWVVGTNLDVTESRRAQEALAAHQRLLEQRVEERTAELKQAQATLRRTERLAAMGTLAAGLGHDLTNIMLPIRWRLDALTKEDLTGQARADFADVIEGMQYLERLAAGLRHMAANPDAAPPPGGTELGEWWAEAAGMMRSVLPRAINLVTEIPTRSPRSRDSGLPPVNINRIGLTQAVFNLVQNAGEVLAPRNSGTVTISARVCPDDGGKSVELTVRDDGPGMTPEVAARCFEPYFSTKGRAVSTGMGLSLVRGVVETVGGTVDLKTAPGEGAAFTLRIPAAAPGVGPWVSDAGGREVRVAARLEVADARRAAVVGAMLEMMGVRVVRGGERSDAAARSAAPERPEVQSPGGQESIWVVDPRPPEQVAAFFADGDGERARVVVMMSEPTSAIVPPAQQRAMMSNVIYAGTAIDAQRLRSCFQRAIEMVNKRSATPVR